MSGYGGPVGFAGSTGKYRISLADMPCTRKWKVSAYLIEVTSHSRATAALQMRLPRKPLPPQTTSFFFTADAVAILPNNKAVEKGSSARIDSVRYCKSRDSLNASISARDMTSCDLAYSTAQAAGR